MRILHITATVDPASGGPIEGLIRQNEVTRNEVYREIVTLDPPDASFLTEFPMVVHALGVPRPSGRRGFLAHYGYTAALIPWLKANVSSYDAVIVNGLWNYAPFAASQVLPRGNAPYFVFTHGMMDPWFRKAYPFKHWLKQAFWLVGEGRLMRGAQAVLFTCEEEKLQARGVFFGHPYVEAVVGYGAVDPPREDPSQEIAFRAAVPGLAKRKYLLFLSRIHPKKGCDLLVRAFAQVADLNPDVDLVIAGPDQTKWREELEPLARRLGVGDRIHWPGPLFGAAKWGGLRGAEAFALPSHQENFGIAVAESLACGTPVLISDKVNIWREIETAGAGLVAPDNLEGTRKLLVSWLNLSVSAREAMAEAARDVFQARFNVINTAPQVIETIKLLSSRGRVNV